jgi:hypothetical protein
VTFEGDTGRLTVSVEVTLSGTKVTIAILEVTLGSS